MKRKLESTTNPPRPPCKQEGPKNNSAQNKQKRRQIAAKRKTANVFTEEFNYQQYDQEQIKREQMMRRILQDMLQELPAIQKTGEIMDNNFGIPKSEVDLIRKIAAKHRANSALTLPSNEK